MTISNCEFVIVRISDNYILYQANPGDTGKHYASAKHVQPLLDLIPHMKFTLEVRP